MGVVNRIPNLPFFYLCFRAWSHWRGKVFFVDTDLCMDHADGE